MSAPARLMSVAEQSVHFLTRHHDGPPEGQIDAPAAWTGADLRRRDDWIEPVSPAFVGALEAAIERVRGRPWTTIGAAEARLVGQSQTVSRWRETLRRGRGFLVLRGLPVARWDDEARKVATGILGLQFGTLGLQNPQGDVIGEVRATGVEKADPYARLYATAGEFRFHCDASDLVGLLCIRPAATGGESRIASSVTVYNRLLNLRPDLAALLFQPQPYDLRNEQAAGVAPYAWLAPCAHAEGGLRTFYISDYFRTAARHGAPVRTDLIDSYDALAGDPDVGLSFFLRPGDLQVLNNHVCLHARTAFEDAAGRERLLLRFLVSMDA